jgi:cephalosporin hydroxylase
MKIAKKFTEFILNKSRLGSSKLPIRAHGGVEFEVDGWALSEFVLKKIVPVSGVHPFPLQELMLMCAAVCRLQPSVIFEWGTNIGKSARIFFETTEHYGVPCQIHSIDLPDNVSHVEHPHEQRGVMVRGLNRVQLHQGDGLETSLAIWRQSGSPSNPFFFIDGDHSYDSVLREIEGIIGVIPGASMLMHDTFLQSSESGYNVGPHRAVSEIMVRHPLDFHAVHSGLSLPGMTLIIPAQR